MGNHQFDRIFCSILRCDRLVRTTKTGLAARSCVLILMKNLLPNSVKHLENQWVAGDRILEHWEMCSVRSVMTKIPSCRLVLEHREV